MSNKIDKHLLLNETQKQRLTWLIENDHMVEMYWGREQQNEAIAFLNQHSLLPEQIKSGLTKWKTRHSRKDLKTMNKVLYQCTTGSYVSSHKDIKGTGKNQQQYKFTECLAFIEITTDKETGCIVRVMGYLEHLEACKRAIRVALPILNLHPLVKEMALDLLKVNASTNQILTDNQKFIEQKCNGKVIIGNNRLLLKASDITNIMRNFRMTHLNINTRMQVENSLDQIFGNNGDSILKEACFHYQPKTIDNRLEIGISTKNQRDLAWLFGHENILLLDGTFGVCNRKILFFILMILDQQRQGIPIAYFIFSPPSQNKCTSSGYDHKILGMFFQKFVTALGTKNNMLFTPKVFIIMFFYYYLINNF